MATPDTDPDRLSPEQLLGEAIHYATLAFSELVTMDPGGPPAEGVREAIRLLRDAELAL